MLGAIPEVDHLLGMARREIAGATDVPGIG